MMPTLITARELALRLLSKGVAGDASLLYRWAQMYFNLQRRELSIPFAEFKQDYFQDVQNAFGDIPWELGQTIHEEEIEIALRKLYEENVLEQVPPFNEYRLRDFENRCRSLSLAEGFFACNDLTLNPLQYIRSRVIRFCECHKIVPTQKDEIVIAVTEAAENAVKYSDQYMIYFWHCLEKNTYSVKIYNSVPELDLNTEINRGKFSEDVSLMRGVLVMSKLLDYLDIIRDTIKKRVEFVGSKKVTFTSP